MIINFEGRTWEFEVEDVTIKQAVAIHLAYGWNLDQWFRALEDTDPRALQCLWWLMLQQDGQAMPITEADCRLIALAAAFGDAQDEGEAEAEPGPTSPPSPPEGPPSPVPSTRMATTPERRARPPRAVSTVSTQAI